MSVIDNSSRFVFLRPLQTKETSVVAEHLLDIYNEPAPPPPPTFPEILQSDQGTELKGTVKAVCEGLNVKINNSLEYGPQTQGKDE